MGEVVLKDPFVSLNNVVLSDHFKQVNISPVADTPEKTHFGDDWRGRIGGLKDFSVSLEYNQDYDPATGLDFVMFPLLGKRIPFEIRSSSAIRAPGNPSWTGFVIVGEYSPLSGSVGEVIMGNLNLPGDGILNRLTA